MSYIIVEKVIVPTRFITRLFNEIEFSKIAPIDIIYTSLCSFDVQLIACELFSFQTKQSVQKLQIIVSSDGRFRNLREALHRCDPPCIPYLGMYLSDLSFLEEGTPSLADDGLLNFSKLRMVSDITIYRCLKGRML